MLLHRGLYYKPTSSVLTSERKLLFTTTNLPTFPIMRGDQQPPVYDDTDDVPEFYPLDRFEYGSGQRLHGTISPQYDTSNRGLINANVLKIPNLFPVLTLYIL